MSNKESLIDKLIIPTGLHKNLKAGRFISVGHRILKATVKPKNVRGNINGGREYLLDFIEVPKEFVKDLNKDDGGFISDIYRHYNLDYDFFIPCNIQSEYEFIVDDIIWNSYHFPPFKHNDFDVSDDIDKKCPTIMTLYRHIYGDYLDLALDYVTVEFNEPSQPLPVQVLYSRENNTGKTTILLHKQNLYGNNSSIIDSGTFDDKFNSMIAGKNFVGIDEGKLKDEAALERLKANVTNPTIPLREMRRSPVKVPNFGKYAIATNKDNWAKLDKKDSRFWVIPVPIIQGKFDPKFEKKMFDESPDFAGFLVKRWSMRLDREQKESMLKMKFWKKEGRLWFLHENYITKAFDDAVRQNANLDTKAFLDELMSWFQSYNFGKSIDDRISEIYANTSLLRNNLVNLPPRITTPIIKNILEKDLELKRVMNKKGTKAANARFTNYFDPMLNKMQQSNVYLIKLDDIATALGSESSMLDGVNLDANVKKQEKDPKLFDKAI